MGGRRECAAGRDLGEGTLDAAPFQELIRQIILDELKPQYEDRKHWGQKGRVLTGVKVKGKWFEPYLEKRTKEVNDGLWQRYVVTLVEPAKNLHVRFDQTRSVDANRFSLFSLSLECKMRGEAHIERWRKGVKMLNVSAQGDMVVQARLDCDLAIRLEPEPKVRQRRGARSAGDGRRFAAGGSRLACGSVCSDTTSLTNSAIRSHAAIIVSR